MPYGTIKVDTITFTDAGVDKSVAISGLVQNPTFTGNVTATGTISGLIVQAPTVTGTTANFASGVYTTQISGAIVKVPAGGAGAPSIQVGVGASVAPGLYGAGTDLLGISTGGAGRIFIDSTGRLGVGTSSPTTPLHVLSSSFPLATFKSSAASTGNNISFVNDTDVGVTLLTYGSTYAGGSVLSVGASGTALSATNDLAIAGGNTLRLGTASTERLRIDSSGNVGIGTTSPSNTAGFSQQLEVAGSLPCISINQNNGSFTTRKYSLGADSVGCFGIWDNTSNSYRFYAATSGNVGIGTSSPGYSLHILGSTANLAIQDSGANGTRALIEATNSAVYYGSTYGASNISTIFSQAGASGGIERMRIDSSGRLLVGTSSSRQVNASIFPLQLQIEGTTYQSSSMSLVANLNSIDGSYIVLGKSRGTSLNSSTIVNSDDSLGAFWFCGADGNTMPRGAIIEAQVDGTPGANDMPGRLVFSTTADGASSPTERMRITNSGLTNLFVTANDGFQSRNSAAAGTTIAVFAGRHSATNTTNGTVSFQVWTNGNVQNTNNSYGAISDIKLKENIVNANSQWDDIKALQVRNYNFKEGQTHTQIGLVAQEAELVSPGLISESPDRDEEGNDLGTVTKSVNYSVLYMKAVKALQEAMDRIETLEAKVAALEGN
jgi:hypothetical protein